MSKNLREAFDSLHADPALKESTRAFLREKTGNYTAPEPRRRSGGFRRLAPALACAALLVVGLPYLVKISLGLSSLHYSFAEAALSLGSIVGGLLSGLVLRGADIRRAWRFLLGTSLLLLPMALALALGIPSLAAYGVILVSVLLGMACAMLFTVSAQTYLQRATPPHLLGKVASFVAAISTCAMPLGQALYGLLFDALQAHVWVVVALGMGASLLVTFSSVRALGRLPALDEAPSGGYTEQSLDS